MSNSSALNVLTTEQRMILLAIFNDCREFYPSRSDFDSDYKVLRNTSLDMLYDAWREYNALLVQNSPFHAVPLLRRWPVKPIEAVSHREVRAARQTLGFFSRLEGHTRSCESLIGFRQRVSAARGLCPKVYERIARDLINAWLGPCPQLLDLHPNHGPGAVAERYSSLKKRDPEYTFRQLAPFGGDDLLYLNEHHRAQEPRQLTVLKHPITRVVEVPKDFKKTRVISAEPCVMQFLQQGLARYMMAHLEMTCPFVNFRDQTVNAQLARRYADVATLDLSNASDTVSRMMVRQLFPEDWFATLSALRSHFSIMPDGTKVPLRAFAPMGSALCFPVETVVFAAISVAAYLVFSGNERSIGKGRSLIRIYGDDIIVPLEAGEYVREVLRECGFQPNMGKCCVRGRFRESCGAEWFGGEDITVVRPRSLKPLSAATSRGGTIGIVPMVQYANALHARGFSDAAQMLANLCKFPVALGKGDAYATPDLRWPITGPIRWNTKLQRCEQLSTVPVQVQQPSDVGTTWSGLFLGLASGWRSELVLTPRVKPKRKWVLAAPLADR